MQAASALTFDRSPARVYRPAPTTDHAVRQRAAEGINICIHVTIPMEKALQAMPKHRIFACGNRKEVWPADLGLYRRDRQQEARPLDRPNQVNKHQ
ncbi:MAG: hypothetical protein ACTTJL_04730 [Hoylesella enoeca]|uniref:hypothetical protein n=1 Tax=Hoylesella enoeca TaxID=76123 RepID=UPI003FA14DF4